MDNSLPPDYSKDVARAASDRRINDRQTGVAMPTIAGNGNGDPDMRKLYSPELAQSMMTTDGPNGMRCGALTVLYGNSVFTPGDPMLKSHSATSDLGGTYAIVPGSGPPDFHNEIELIPVGCGPLQPPDGAVYPWVYYHIAGSGFDTGYYYYLSPTDGPHPGRGPGWPL